MRNRAGIEVSPYYVLEYPDWVHIVALHGSENVLLVKQYRHGLRDISLELPAGSVEGGDGSILDAAARELAEETGYASPELKVVSTASASTARFANRLHVILALDVKPIPCPPLPDKAEAIQFEIVPIEAAVQMALSGQIVDATTSLPYSSRLPLLADSTWTLGELWGQAAILA